MATQVVSLATSVVAVDKRWQRRQCSQAKSTLLTLCNVPPTSEREREVKETNLISYLNMYLIQRLSVASAIDRDNRQRKCKTLHFMCRTICGKQVTVCVAVCVVQVASCQLPLAAAYQRWLKLTFRYVMTLIGVWSMYSYMLQYSYSPQHFLLLNVFIIYELINLLLPCNRLLGNWQHPTTIIISRIVCFVCCGH